MARPSALGTAEGSASSTLFGRERGRRARVACGGESEGHGRSEQRRRRDEYFSGGRRGSAGLTGRYIKSLTESETVRAAGVRCPDNASPGTLFAIFSSSFPQD